MKIIQNLINKLSNLSSMLKRHPVYQDIQEETQVPSGPLDFNSFASISPTNSRFKFILLTSCFMNRSTTFQPIQNVRPLIIIRRTYVDIVERANIVHITKGNSLSVDKICEKYHISFIHYRWNLWRTNNTLH